MYFNLGGIKVSFFIQNISVDAKDINNHASTNWSELQKLVFASFMSILATFLQSAGGYLPGVGFLISPFTTLPILIITIISIRYGTLSFILTAILLLLIEPSELFIYPFTTGVLGLSLGTGYRLLYLYWKVLALSGCLLSLGIYFPLYVLGFPVFGSTIVSTVNIYIIIFIFVFSVLYTAIWIWISQIAFKRIKAIFVN